MPWIKTEHVCPKPVVYLNGQVSDVVDYDLPDRVGPGSVWECPDSDCKKQWRLDAGMMFEQMPKRLKEGE